jgi:hypothetical protein
VPVSPDIGTHRHAKPSKAALVFFILNIRPYDVRVNSPQGSAARPARLPWIYPHLCAAISRGRSAGSPRVPRGGVRGCAAGALAGAPRVPRILRGFPADSPRIFRGFSAGALGGPADFPRVQMHHFAGQNDEKAPADFPRMVPSSARVNRGVPRVLRGFSAGPADSPWIFRGCPRGSPTDFHRCPAVSARAETGGGGLPAWVWVWGELCCGLVVWARAPGSGEPQHLLAVSSSPRIL